MAFSVYAPSDDEIRITRTLIPDTEAVFGPTNNATMFSDDEITDFLSAGGGSILRGAALANYTIATSEALISKVIATQDLKTNGAALALALIAKGDALMKRADKGDEQLGIDFFQIIDYREGWTSERPELTEADYNAGY